MFLDTGWKQWVLPLWKILPKYRPYFLKLIFDYFYQEGAHALIVTTAGSAVLRLNAVAKMKRKRLFLKKSKMFFILNLQINYSVSKWRIKFKLNAWSTAMEMNVWLAMKRIKKRWTIAHVEKIVLVRPIKISFIFLIMTVNWSLN